MILHIGIQSVIMEKMNSAAANDKNQQVNGGSMHKNFLFLAVFVGLCGLLFTPNCISYPDNLIDCGMNELSYMYYVDYDVNIDARTPDGIPVDTAGRIYDLEMLDEMALEVKECIKKNFPSLSVTKEVREAGACSEVDFRDSYWNTWNYGCWQVKFDPDWTVGCSGNQVLSQGPPVPAGTQCGGKKDMITTRECPCRYRMAVFGKTFVITPDARLFKDGLVRAITSCKNPWGHPLLSECASP